MVRKPIVLRNGVTIKILMFLRPCLTHTSGILQMDVNISHSNPNEIKTFIIDYKMSNEYNDINLI